ncbi:MAG: B12-binding domain-containing radical SAM protein, partial [Clostridia bacterium]|nr:B12-binding domain-containing radical SAM protein [Clostridia bacterium]
TGVKLYFMNGLPTETREDIDGIADLASKVINRYYTGEYRQKGLTPSVTVSVSCFIPKPFTAFQWEAQDDLQTLRDKQMYLATKITDRKRIRYNWHEAKVSVVEAVFARGDRKLSAALLEAHKLGIRFDGWDEMFSYDKWMQAFEAAGIDVAFYATRSRALDEVLPWDIIDCGVTKEFLLRERAKAYEASTTPNCKEKCSGCGANKLGGKRTWCTRSCE